MQVATADIPAALDAAAAAIAAALAATDRWGESGQRPGQYHSDLAADAAAVATLTAAGLAVLSEESGFTPGVTSAAAAGVTGGSGVTVVVDPLDGSTNASRGIGGWATSLCAVDADGPLAALVVDLRHGTRWTAVRGEGARRDDVVLGPRDAVPLDRSIIGLNGVPDGHGGWAQYRALGACALDLCAVADGTLDGYLDCTVDELGVWDYLGGALVGAEAGVVVVDAAGRDLCVLEHGARRIPVAGAGADGRLTARLRALHPRHGSSAADSAADSSAGERR